MYTLAHTSSYAKCCERLIWWFKRQGKRLENRTQSLSRAGRVECVGEMVNPSSLELKYEWKHNPPLYCQRCCGSEDESEWLWEGWRVKWGGAKRSLLSDSEMECSEYLRHTDAYALLTV